MNSYRIVKFISSMKDQPQKPRRRWFQFSLRSLLIVVTLVAGLLVAWRVYVVAKQRTIRMGAGDRLR